MSKPISRSTTVAVRAGQLVFHSQCTRFDRQQCRDFERHLLGWWFEGTKALINEGKIKKDNIRFSRLHRMGCEYARKWDAIEFLDRGRKPLPEQDHREIGDWFWKKRSLNLVATTSFGRTRPKSPQLASRTCIQFTNKLSTKFAVNSLRYLVMSRMPTMTLVKNNSSAFCNRTIEIGFDDWSMSILPPPRQICLRIIWLRTLSVAWRANQFCCQSAWRLPAILQSHSCCRWSVTLASHSSLGTKNTHNVDRASWFDLIKSKH